uniref:Uncharacterized protein n=1 Tax=Fibrocapsa japonica TaxID=94617 RepID=A0A6U1PC24_9STRA|mmetsp:Transcript_3671/g.5448  ORF Transcript_3671/g.5448 Transcript_3671/m.5448 type:complete len:198 (+) Transcript_3671:112-705(+)|eukprot:CAMPEP_0113939136 /NCGR_PEP_ID=MMETSP1339-20121228/5508_1 /TAXON_ID=94617 /ORGANISM="Fibrocapsa japonica" /LENGTH=197 /DNA_ID=CAMNT_0000942559 /DNA_START=112 /DNA_END=705 /DNA_ORIENTATION=- /assembly_acc=CAM_ASM_000762
MKLFCAVITLVLAAVAPAVMAFQPMAAPALSSSTKAFSSPRVAPLQGTVEEEAIAETLIKAENLKLLTRVSKLGLLSKAEKFGISLSKLEPFLKLADESGVLLELEKSSAKTFPLLPKAVDQAPALLSLAESALALNPSVLLAGAAASAAAGAYAIYAIPDDSITNMALQSFIAIPLIAVIPGAAVVGSTVLSKLKA